MATKSRVQRYFDIIRGKRGWGAVVNLDVSPTHFGARYIYEGEATQTIIRDVIERGRPGLIVRPGRTELKVVAEFLNQIDKPTVTFTKKWRSKASINAGFFTPTNEMLTRFACETLTMCRDADVFMPYRAVVGEKTICERYLAPETILCSPGGLAPFLFANPWSAALRGKKVLVVHPFVETIREQYTRRDKLFANPDVLPEFELKTVKAVQSSASVTPAYPDWFAALEAMQREIDGTDFDVALVGAGAYGFFLAHHCKKIGKVGIQVASAGQLLFGIYGSRWVDASGKPADFINEYWVKPSENERPPGADLVEGACYW
ncbi:MAG: hypothetical protein LUE17_09850 [Planctomycetaceae bacterium]|nr:hypothetical protein [Planctomycetaceae bacterium]